MAKNLETIKKEILDLVAGNKLKEAKSQIPELIASTKTVDELLVVRATIEKVHLADAGNKPESGKPKTDLIKIYEQIVDNIKANDFISAKKHIAESRKGVKFKKAVEVDLIKSVEKLVKDFYNDNPDQEPQDVDSEEVDDVSDSKIYEEAIANTFVLFETVFKDNVKFKKILVKLKSQISKDLDNQDISKSNFDKVTRNICVPLIYSSISNIGLEKFKTYMKAQLQMLLAEEDKEDSDIEFLKLLKCKTGIDSEETLNDFIDNQKSISILTEKIIDLYFVGKEMKDLIESFYKDNDIDNTFEELNSLLYGTSAIDYLSECVTEKIFEPANKYLNELISEIGTTNILLKNPDFVHYSSSLEFSINIEDDEFVKRFYRNRLEECVINKNDEDVKKFFNPEVEEVEEPKEDDNEEAEVEENPYEDILAILK